MSALGRIATRLRNFKPAWVLYNLAHYRRLRGNAAYYRKFGVRKSVVTAISHKDIAKPSDEIPWLDRPDAREALAAHPEFHSFPNEVQDGLREWIETGYLVLDGFFDDARIDALNAEVERLMTEGAVGFHYRGNRIMNAFEHSNAVAALVGDERLTRLLRFILGRDVSLFQTINFFEGSEQRPHSDSFHMTTEPLGYLIAIWVALEDVAPDSGPLVYFPGSHRLPYVMSEDFDRGGSALFLGSQSQENYEEKIDQVLSDAGAEPELFLARKGDVLVWHANLLHGGRPITRSGATRKSLVAHYFAEGVLRYHEVTARPALVQG